MWKRLAFALGLVALLAGIALLWKQGWFPRVRAHSPNVIVYLVDTLRPDHLGVYGHTRPTSPELDAFARDAIVFENAYSPTSWTRPAAASLITGLSPSHHRANGRIDVIRPEIELLSEHFQAAGYRTLGFVANPNVLSVWGFDRGFDLYRDIDSESLSSRADTVVDSVLHALDGLAPDERFFVYVHTLDPHEPYLPPAPFNEMFEVPGNQDAGYYDGEVAFGDVHFGRLVDWLRAHQRYHDTIVVFLSDHGEELQDHAGTGHGHTLFEEVVRIPLVIKLPHGERAGERVPAIATLMDVLPTLLTRIGVAVPAGLDGNDLFASPTAGAATSERPLFLDLDLDWHEGRTDIVRGVRAGNFKYLRRLRPTAEEALYDLARDPAEKTDARSSAPAAFTRLRALLDGHVTATSSGIHLRLSNSEWGATRVCSAHLTTTGRFVDLATRLFEAGDRAELGARDTQLDLSVTLANYPHPTGGIPRVIVDEDSIVFRVEPRDAEIELASIARDGAAPCPVWRGARHGAAPERFAFRSDEPDLAVVDVAELLRSVGKVQQEVPMGVYLAVVPERQVAEHVPEDVQKRLRELGYLEGDAPPNDDRASRAPP